jgi:hypothetical protein
MTASNVVMQSPAFPQRNTNQSALGSICRLANGFRNFTGLAVAVAHATLLVADDDESSKAETTAALHDFRDAVDVDEPIHEFGVAFFAILTLSWFSCHSGLSLKTRVGKSAIRSLEQ